MPARVHALRAYQGGCARDRLGVYDPPYGRKRAAGSFPDDFVHPVEDLRVERSSITGAPPIGLVASFLHEPMKARVRPSVRAPYVSVPDRIVMDVVADTLELLFVPHRTLPEAPMPYASLAVFAARSTSTSLCAAAREKRTRKPEFDEAQTRREIMVVIG